MSARKFLTPLQLVPLPGAPADPQAGWVYFDEQLDKARYYDGSIWVSFPADSTSGEPPASAISLETGDDLLTESGDRLLIDDSAPSSDDIFEILYWMES